MKRLSVLTIALLVIAVLVALVFRSCGHTVTLKPETVKLRDSLVVTRKPDSLTRDSLVRRADSSHASAVGSVTAAGVHSHKADSLSRLAASLAAEAKTSKDSAAKWRSAYFTEVESNTELRHSNDSLKAAVASEHKATLAEIEARVKAEIRLAKTEKLNTDISNQIKDINKCRVGPFPCITRTQANILGIVEGVAATTLVVVVVHNATQ